MDRFLDTVTNEHATRLSLQDNSTVPHLDDVREGDEEMYGKARIVRCFMIVRAVETGTWQVACD